MKMCAYGREPLDLKLMCLLMLKKIWLFVLGTAAGGVLFGGVYFATQIMTVGVTYEATGTYYVEYNTDPVTGQEYTYINGVTWDTVWVKSDAFLQKLLVLIQADAEKITGPELTAEQLKTYLSADLPSDLRIPTVTVTTESPQLTMLLCRAVEQAMVELSDVNQEIREIRVLSSPAEAVKTVVDNRTWSALILGCVLGLFLTVFVWIIGFFLDDSVYVPTTFEYRYQIPMLGTLQSPGLKALLKHFFHDKKRIAVLGVDEEADMTPIARALEAGMAAGGPEEKEAEFVPMPGLEQCPEAAEQLKTYDGLVLGVQAGARDGKRIEQQLSILEKLEIPVTAAVLLDADESLQKAYYFPGYRGEKK